MKSILTGLDQLREGQWKKLRSSRIGLLANQASLDSGFNTALEVISRVLPRRLTAIFGPQHGYGGEDQDNMIETEDSYDKALNIPVFSLYADVREPHCHMLEMIDVLIIDLQDVGTRVYTFASTMLNCIRSAAVLGKKVIVLDRPNPLGGEKVEGNLLQPDLYSFVGPYSLPMRHGLTMGEMALIFNHSFDLDCDLEIIPMSGWHRNMLWSDTGLRWIMPSPNMPSPETALVYPGQVIWEGTNISEGRGTCRPFEIFGAPFLDIKAIKNSLEPEATRGCYLQEFLFRPTFHKWEGKICRGFMIHVTDPHIYRPSFTSIAILRKIMQIHEKEFSWKSPPYEYEYEKMPIDLILGDSSFRLSLESGVSFSHIKERFDADMEYFIKWRKPYLLYT